MSSLKRNSNHKNDFLEPWNNSRFTSWLKHPWLTFYNSEFHACPKHNFQPSDRWLRYDNMYEGAADFVTFICTQKSSSTFQFFLFPFFVAACIASARRILPHNFLCLHAGVNFPFAIVHYLPFTDRGRKNLHSTFVFLARKNNIFVHTHKATLQRSGVVEKKKERLSE